MSVAGLHQKLAAAFAIDGRDKRLARGRSQHPKHSMRACAKTFQDLRLISFRRTRNSREHMVPNADRRARGLAAGQYENSGWVVVHLPDLRTGQKFTIRIVASDFQRDDFRQLAVAPIPVLAGSIDRVVCFELFQDALKVNFISALCP